MTEKIEFVKNTYNKDVFACVTDNENKMVAMRTELESKYNILTYGCSAHYANLVAGKAIEPNTKSRVVHIQKHFRNHHRAHGLLKEKGGQQPKIPLEVRWNSYYDTLVSFMANINIYVDVCTDHYDDESVVDVTTRNFIEDINLRVNVRHELTLMKKFSIAVDKLQSENCRYYKSETNYFKLTFIL